MSTRLAVTLTFAVVNAENGVIREQRYGAVSPATVEGDADSLALIVANTLREELPIFLKAK